MLLVTAGAAGGARVLGVGQESDNPPATFRGSVVAAKKAIDLSEMEAPIQGRGDGALGQVAAALGFPDQPVRIIPVPGAQHQVGGQRPFQVLRDLHLPATGPRLGVPLLGHASPGSTIAPKRSTVTLPRSAFRKVESD